MATTVHRKHQGEQRTYLVVPATDATGREVGDWEPNEELINDDAPQSALDAVREAADV